MSLVVIFRGSPRPHGFTNKLLDKVAEGARSKGAEVLEFNLNDPGIRGCQGCFYCRTHDGCATQDVLQPMYEAIAKADAVVLGSPIYYYQISGQARVWLDRTFPMVGDKFAARHPGKKAVTVFAQGNANPEVGAQAIQFVNGIFESTYGWKVEDSIQLCGANNPDTGHFDELAARAFRDGERLAE